MVIFLQKDRNFVFLRNQLKRAVLIAICEATAPELLDAL